MPNRHFLRSDIFTFVMVYSFYFRLLSPNESDSYYVRCFGVPTWAYTDIFSRSLLRIRSAHSLIL